MNEVVYVCDIDTYEIVYMNRMMRDMHNINSIDEVKDKTCYEFFQGCGAPCAICTNRELEPGRFKEWKYFNPKEQKTFMIKDTIIEEDDRRYRMEIAIDVTLHEKQKQIIKNYMDNEAMINEALQISLSSSNPDESINKLIDYLGKSLNSDRVYIFEIDKDGTYSNTYEWCARGIEPNIDNLQHIPVDIIEGWMLNFQSKKGVIVRNRESVKNVNPEMYEFLDDRNIDSIVANPILNNDELIGFYGVDNPPSDIIDNISVLFDIMSKFFTSILNRRNLIKQLELLSYSDQMTQCGNRRGLDIYVSTISPTDALGIMFCDLTGLKLINDKEGHSAGDKKLMDAVNCFRDNFNRYEIFRIGGDEFLILCKGISHEEFNLKINNLKKDSEQRSVPLAIGAIWQERYQDNIQELIADADQLMYEDKEKQHEHIRGFGSTQGKMQGYRRRRHWRHSRKNECPDGAAVYRR
jgi:diguanylate cyclase (GGDEF)-like protein